MLRYDPAFIHIDGMKSILMHYHTHGPRPKDPDSWIMIYTQIPGYKSSIMDPTVGRWASFGWDRIERDYEFERALKTPPVVLSDWITVVGFSRSGIPLRLTLQDWVDCKSMNVWADKIHFLKCGAEVQESSRAIRIPISESDGKNS